MKTISKFHFKCLFLFLLKSICLMQAVTAQINGAVLFALPDSMLPFSMNTFYGYLLNNHPVAQQISLLSDVARQEIRFARGNFDPKIEAEYLQKNFKKTEYFDALDAGLKFPSILPFDPKIGYQRNEGTFLNPERFIPDEFNFSQFYAGVSLPLGRGLITDPRRTALKQAELFTELTEAEQVRLVNNLLLEAAKDYWNWYHAFYNYRVLSLGVEVASDLFERVKLVADLGEAATVDTVQAKITLQERLLQQQEAYLEYLNTGINLSNYLWDSATRPLQLQPFWAPIRPDTGSILSFQILEELKQQALINHPDLKKIDVKLRRLEVERKLAVEFLKPRVDASYTLLNQPIAPNLSTRFDLNNNYKWGLDVHFPVFLRKERARLAQTKLQIQSTSLEKTIAERNILNDIEVSYNQLATNGKLIDQLDDMVNGYQRLLQAELLNLENGESDLLRVNIQQEKLIQAQSKYIKLIANYEKNKALLYWSAGTYQSF